MEEVFLDLQMQILVSIIIFRVETFKVMMMMMMMMI